MSALKEGETNWKGNSNYQVNLWRKYSLQRTEQRVKTTVCTLWLLLNAKLLQSYLSVVSKAPNGLRLALGLQAITSQL